MKYCKADVARLCPGVQMGGGRIIACLKEHKMEISVGCGKALQAMKAQDGQVRASGALAPPTQNRSPTISSLFAHSALARSGSSA